MQGFLTTIINLWVASNEILTLNIVLRVTKDYRPPETFTFERLGVQTRFDTCS